MNTKSITNVFIVLLAAFVGWIVGFGIKNYPVFKLDNSIKVNEIIDTVVTLFIGIALPLLAKRYIEKLDSKSNFLVEEISVFESRTNELKCLIQDIYKSKQMTNSDKEMIDTEFEFYDIDFTQLNECIEKFPNNQELQREFKLFFNQYVLLWKLATGKSINDAKVKSLPLDSYKKINAVFIKQSAHLRKLRTLYKAS